MADGTPASSLRYYSAHGGKSLLWAGQDMLALFVLVQFLRIDALVAGTLFMVASVLNAGMDIIAGSLLARFSRSATWPATVVAGAILLCSVSFALLPWLPRGAAIPAAIVLIVSRLSHSMLDVAHNALSTGIARVEGNFSMAQRRAVIASTTAMLIGLVAIPLRAGASREAMVALLIAALALLAFLGLAPLPDLMRRMSAGPTPHPVARRSMPRAITLLCVATLLSMMALGALIKCLLHLQFPSAWIGSIAMVIYMGARFVAVWFWQPVVARLGNLGALRGACALLACAALALPLLSGTIAGSVAAIIILGIGGGGSAMLCWAALTELIQSAGNDDRGDGADMGQAWIYGVFTMSAKIGLGLSGLAVGAWLELVPRSGGSFTNASNLWSIALAAAFCCLLSAALLKDPRPGVLKPLRFH